MLRASMHLGDPTRPCDCHSLIYLLSIRLTVCCAEGGTSRDELKCFDVSPIHEGTMDAKRATMHELPACKWVVDNI